MRVIAGDLKGQTFETVANKLTRPTSDKIKESLFNIIGPFFNGGYALDLFAGSGNLGIEALSRGIDQVIFVDQQRQAIQVIKQNITKFQLNDRVEVYQNDAFRALKAIGKREIEFDLIFLDPPYKKGFYKKLLEEIDRNSIANHSTTIVCEHESKDILPQEIGTFYKIRSEKYGSTTTISFYQRKDEGNE